MPWYEEKKSTILKAWINELIITLPGNSNTKVTYIGTKLK